ncbi:MAG: hypothetical protein Tsb005_00160 [Gammaproteobacteria bacterium]
MKPENKNNKSLKQSNLSSSEYNAKIIDEFLETEKRFCSLMSLAPYLISDAVYNQLEISERKTLDGFLAMIKDVEDNLFLIDDSTDSSAKLQRILNMLNSSMFGRHLMALTSLSENYNFYHNFFSSLQKKYSAKLPESKRLIIFLRDEVLANAMQRITRYKLMLSEISGGKISDKIQQKFYFVTMDDLTQKTQRLNNRLGEMSRTNMSKQHYLNKNKLKLGIKKYQHYPVAIRVQNANVDDCIQQLRDETVQNQQKILEQFKLPAMDIVNRLVKYSSLAEELHLIKKYEDSLQDSMPLMAHLANIQGEQQPTVDLSQDQYNAKLTLKKFVTSEPSLPIINDFLSANRAFYFTMNRVNDLFPRKIIKQMTAAEVQKLKNYLSPIKKQKLLQNPFANLPQGEDVDILEFIEQFVVQHMAANDSDKHQHMLALSQLKCELASGKFVNFLRTLHYKYAHGNLKLETELQNFYAKINGDLTALTDAWKAVSNSFNNINAKLQFYNWNQMASQTELKANDVIIAQWPGTSGKFLNGLKQVTLKFAGWRDRLLNIFGPKPNKLTLPSYNRLNLLTSLSVQQFTEQYVSTLQRYNEIAAEIVLKMQRKESLVDPEHITLLEEQRRLQANLRKMQPLAENIGIPVTTYALSSAVQQREKQHQQCEQQILLNKVHTIAGQFYQAHQHFFLNIQQLPLVFPHIVYQRFTRYEQEKLDNLTKHLHHGPKIVTNSTQSLDEFAQTAVHNSDYLLGVQQARDLIRQINSPEYLKFLQEMRYKYCNYDSRYARQFDRYFQRLLTATYRYLNSAEQVHDALQTQNTEAARKVASDLFMQLHGEDGFRLPLEMREVSAFKHKLQQQPSTSQKIKLDLMYALERIKQLFIKPKSMLMAPYTINLTKNTTVADIRDAIRNTQQREQKLMREIKFAPTKRARRYLQKRRIKATNNLSKLNRLARAINLEAEQPLDFNEQQQQLAARRDLILQEINYVTSPKMRTTYLQYLSCINEALASDGENNETQNTENNVLNNIELEVASQQTVEQMLESHPIVLINPFEEESLSPDPFEINENAWEEGDMSIADEFGVEVHSAVNDEFKKAQGYETNRHANGLDSNQKTTLPLSAGATQVMATQGLFASNQPISTLRSNQSCGQTVASELSKLSNTKNNLTATDTSDNFVNNNHELSSVIKV